MPVVAGNQTNGIAGTRDNIVTGQAEKKTEPEQEYILIPICITDPLISQDPKVSEEDAEEKFTEMDESGASNKDRKDDQATRSEFERLLQQEKYNVHPNSTNSINTVSTPVSVVGPSFTNDDPSSLVNAAEASNAFEEHLFERFSPFKNAFTLPPVSNVTPMDDTGIFGNAYDDEDVGAEADLNNLETTMNVSLIPTTRIDKDHPKDQIIRLQSYNSQGLVEKQTNSTNSFNTVGTPVSAAGPSFTNDDPSSPVNAAEASNAFEEHLFERFSPFKNAFTLPPISNVTPMDDTGIFGNAYDDEDVGAEADLNNLETTMNVSPIPTTRIDKDHPKDQIIGDFNSAIQTRRMTKISDEHAMVSYINKQRRTNHKDYQNCLFACFLSQNEPKKVIQALEDPSWIEAMQEELLQFQLQKVWTLVKLPNGKRAIGTKWVFRNKKDKRVIVIRNKARLVAQAYVSFMGFIVYQMDVKSAFLYGTIEEEIYNQTSKMAEQDTPPPTITAMKIPIIKKGEYDIWSMRMRQYICHTDHNLWDIIVDGDLQEEAAPAGEQPGPPAPKTAKQLTAKRNQERVKSILLLAIPDEYLLKFHNVPDAKSL
ncbi:putative ribonuclease H-like domain-containing protein [Tanacetum coccineum]